MAFQNITGIKLGQAEITTSFTTIYTTPATTRTYVKDINICNTTATSLTVSVCLVPSGGTAGVEMLIL
jgi:hypothetical protein